MNKNEKVELLTQMIFDLIADELEETGQFTAPNGRVLTLGSTTKPKPKKESITKAKNKDVIGPIQSLRSQGLSLQATADELNRQGLTTSRGAKWTAIAVSRVEKAFQEETNPLGDYRNE